MAPSSGELWGHPLMPSMISLDCLLPNGVIVPVDSYRESSLEQVKRDLWRAAKDFPLFHVLQDTNSYIFVSITQDGEMEEFYDESRRLCDLRLFQPVLKLVEPKGNKEEKMLNYDIGIAIGIPVHEFDDMKDPEVFEFRRSVLDICLEAVDKRDERGKESQVKYAYPPEIENRPELPAGMRKKLGTEGFINVAVWSLSKHHEKVKYTVKVLHDAKPQEIIREAIYKRVRNSEEYQSNEERNRVVDEHQSSYVLKVAGSDQYFLEECPISQYKYIRASIAKGATPQLMLMSKKGIYDSIPQSEFHQPAYMRKTPSLPARNTTKLWRLEGVFQVFIQSATYVNVKEADLIYVRVGLFHGTEPLGQVRQTKEVSHLNPRWDEWVQFDDVFYLDLPRAAKLCVSVCAVKKRKNREETTMLCWGNISLFDWRSHLLADKFSLNLWSVPRGMDELLNPLGCTGSNPVKDSPCLELKFDRHPAVVAYPDLRDFMDYSKLLQGIRREPSYKKMNVKRGDLPQKTITTEEQAMLRSISERDPFAEISEQEKEYLWLLRNHCLSIPDILPRFLDSVKWNSRDDLTDLYVLLEEWPPVDPMTALELLDCKYADPTVRRKAVEWLDRMSDEDLAQYLLQLVQTLKYEPYLNNPLSQLLLRRALLNRKIGHFFFWHLRSELHLPSVVVRFGLLLEAFCRGLGPYLKKPLIKQVEALDKLTKLTESLKERFSAESSKDRMKFMFDQIKQADYVESLQYFHSPLENTVMLGELDFSQCKTMDSAKKPLWLVWKNPDELADKLHECNAIIFKNGDDLRQDMLTLQVISVMDHIWHMEGLDLRMTPYTALATGNQVGVIQVVRNAKTVYQIQRKAGKLAAIQVDSTQLYKWIRMNNEKNLDQALDTFTKSCAGYCVATFILGIGDRHPDNIMVNEDGQIFHIDFGHFLGHFKKKFGINRERVPFVLTEDFLNVIANGQENPRQSEKFERFQVLCGEAYLALRRHSNLLITLFTMMLPAGIPELQSINDVGYLRRTLGVEKSEKEALEYFRTMFYDAYDGAWTTKLDWFFHSVKQGL